MKKAYKHAVPYDLHTKATFQALVDAIVLSTPRFAVNMGSETAPGAVDFHVDEYMIWELDHSISLQGDLATVTFLLSAPTAGMLNMAAINLIATNRAKDPQNPSLFPGGGPFASLSRKDRLRAIVLLEQLDIDLYCLPVPYQNNAGLVKSMADALNRMPMFGTFSEWSGYGTTRLAPPDFRRLKFFPPGWIQVGYSGHAEGYRDFRGFVLTMSQVKMEGED